MSDSIIVEYDRTRRMIYTVTAFMDYENISKKSLLSALRDLEEEALSFLDTVYLLWAGLKTDDEKITVKECADILENILSKEKKTLVDVWSNIFEGITKSGALKSFVPKGTEKKST